MNNCMDLGKFRKGYTTATNSICLFRELGLALSLSPLKKALASLNLAIQQPLNEFTRDSVIQRFEYSFELCWKTLKRYLQEHHTLKDDDIRSILREAHQHQLISQIDAWLALHKARNLTSHTYNQQAAEEVYQQAILLPALAQELVSNLEKKISQP